MSIPHTSRWFTCFALVLLPMGAVFSQQVETSDGLTLFTSKEGRFSIRLPGKPDHNTTTVGKAEETQHQFQVGDQQGVYLISYQDNPNLEEQDAKGMQAALKTGRDALQQVFRGELVESEDIKLDDTHPGIAFRFTIPQANGEARCHFYMVGTRLYQILVIGLPEFAKGDEATRVIESFHVLPIEDS